MTTVDAAIIGGGFYGAAIAAYLSRQHGMQEIILLERESALLQRASYHNQARVHNGYHYPRSFTTAYRSRVNLPRFVQDWPEVVKTDFTKLYAIAKQNSKVTAKQFVRFCNEIGASLETAPADLKQLFEPRLVEDVFLTQEYAFDAKKLATWATAELQECGVEVSLNSTVTSVTHDNGLQVSWKTRAGEAEHETAIKTKYVFNCTYGGLNHLGGAFPGISSGIKQEITEMGLVDLPKKYKKLGVTMMDGPFFSMMPFPARELHTLSHVRYTPHCHWLDTTAINPYAALADYDKTSRVDRMIRDVARYMPFIEQAEHRDSLFEVKTILLKNETDDGRPILFEKHHQLPGCYSVLGGKIDNIYDILDRLEEELAVAA